MSISEKDIEMIDLSIENSNLMPCLNCGQKCDELQAFAKHLGKNVSCRVKENVKYLLENKCRFTFWPNLIVLELMEKYEMNELEKPNKKSIEKPKELLEKYEENSTDKSDKKPMENPEIFSKSMHTVSFD